MSVEQDNTIYTKLDTYYYFPSDIEAPDKTILVQHPLDSQKLLEIKQSMSSEEKLRLLCDSDLLPFEHSRKIYQLMFPDEVISRTTDNEGRKFEFEEDTLGTSQDCIMTELQKEARTIVLESLGFKSPRKDPKIRVPIRTNSGHLVYGDTASNQDYNSELLSTLDMYNSIEALHVGFKNDQNTFFSWAFKAPIIHRLDGIGQTSFHNRKDPGPYEGKLKVTRLDHEKHLARMTAQTVIRLAILQPDIFLELYKNDMEYYTSEYKKRSQEKEKYSSLVAFNTEKFIGILRPHEDFSLTFSEDTRNTVNNVISLLENTQDVTESQKQALLVAVEQLKYIELYALLHDALTPAHGDLNMKTKDIPTEPGQKKVEWSEDAQMAKRIFSFIKDDSTGLPQIIEKFDINPALFGIMVQTAAEEKSQTLLGMLIKDKRKNIGDDQEALDHDQVSGTVVNLLDLLTKIDIPFIHKASQQELMPLGELIDVRLRLAMYMRIGHLTKQQLGDYCEKVGIDINQIYIAEEELSALRNSKLAKTTLPGENKQRIMLAFTRAGDVERLLAVFNILQFYKYRSEVTAAEEKFVQTFQACLNDWYSKFEKFGINMMSDIYTNSNDYEALQRLAEVAPIIKWLHTNIKNGKARILTYDEMLQRANTKDGFADCFALNASLPGLVQWKEGTLLATDYEPHNSQEARDEARPYLEVLGQEISPSTIPGRLKSVEEYRKNTQIYFIVGKLTRKEQEEMFQLISSKGNEQTNYAMSRALASWQRDIELNKDTTISPRVSHSELQERISHTKKLLAWGITEDPSLAA